MQKIETIDREEAAVKNTKSKTMKIVIGSVFLFLFLILSAVSYNPVQGIRVNQVGYLPGDIKIALLITSTNLSGQPFYLKSGSGTVFSGLVGFDRGAYASNSHLYELDFSNYSTTGTYSLQVGGYTSPSFKIGLGDVLYKPLMDSTMHYFRYQRCGNTAGAEAGYGNCHFDDAVVKGGPMAGQRLDFTGGWHDANNPPKLIVTFGYSLMQLMIAYDRFSATGVFDGMNYPVLTEAKVGLDWVYKMWDPVHNVLYAQVGEENAYSGTRMAFALDLQPGSGANIAGKSAAALAMGAYLWKDSDPVLSNKWRTAAEQIYVYGKTRQKSWIDPWNFYPETGDPSKGWKDDMALAAVELYRCTNNLSYFNDALNNYLSLAVSESPSGSVGWWDSTAMANYEMARVYPAYLPTAVGYFQNVLSNYANEKYFNTAITTAIWGTVEELSCKAITALWYQDISGDASYQYMANMQRDYIFGRNPWGYSFVDSAGTNYMQNIYTGGRRIGWWGEGPSSVSTLNAANFSVSLGSFDTQDWWYSDVATNYVVNEHTITANSSGLQLLAWYSLGNTTSYAIAASAGSNGSISPSGSISVVQGANQLFSITPSSGFMVSSVLVDGADQGAITSYTFTNVQAAHAISATFAAKPTYTITASAGANGSISPSGNISVAQGSAQAFAISANTGYMVSSVLVDGANQGAIASYNFSNVQANHTIAAAFVAKPTYAIAASAGANGNISPSGSITVAQGSSQAFAISANTGYVVISVSVDGVNKGAITSYTFSNVLANHSISAVFAAKPQYAITASSGMNGTISPSGSVSITQGASQTYTIIPNTGYSISSVTVDGASKGAIATYTFMNVQANHTIGATFKSTTSFTITATAGSNGSISPSGTVKVTQGASQTFSIQANRGHSVRFVLVDNVSKGFITTYTFANVQSNHTISATFR